MVLSALESLGGESRRMRQLPRKAGWGARRLGRAAELSLVARCSDRLELILAAKRERTLSRSLGPVALSHRAEALAYSRASGHRPTPRLKIAFDALKAYKRELRLEEALRL